MKCSIQAIVCAVVSSPATNMVRRLLRISASLNALPSSSRATSRASKTVRRGRGLAVSCARRPRPSRNAGGHHGAERGQGPRKGAICWERDDMPIRHEGMTPAIDRRQYLRQMLLEASPRVPGWGGRPRRSSAW